MMCIFQPFFVFSQNNLNSQFDYTSTKLLNDIGEGWSSLSVFSSSRNNPKIFLRNNKKSFFYINGQFTLESYLDLNSLNTHFYFPLKNNFYIFFNNKFYDNIMIRDQSGIGFQNTWATIELNRGAEIWGSGSNIELALSDNSNNYDYILISSNYGNIRVRYFHGFLETIEQNVNRFISGRGLEWTNKENFILGLSELVVYSGENRSFDIGYLNPMSSHLEVELNNRLNIIGNNQSNAVWQLHLDYLFKKKTRLSLNYLIDEFVLDPNIEIGKEHGRGYSLRFAHTPVFINKNILTFYFSYIYVGTPTFRHGNGANNFVINQKPLGWYKGSDSQDISLGFNYFRKHSFATFFSIGYNQVGEESISLRPYDPYLDYQEGSFPSGQVINSYYFQAKISKVLKNSFLITGEFNFSKNLNIIRSSISYLFY
jgi:hypothetical protein